jgi:benzoyl-CoA-dihydrodiol lyase
LDIGLLIVKTEGNADDVKMHENWVADNAENDWFIREVELFQARTLRKLDNMSKSIFALIEEGSCFVGTLFEMALCGDRIYMFLDDDEQNTVELTAANSGRFPMANGWTRLAARFQNVEASIQSALDQIGEALMAEDALDFGLVSDALDDIDYEDEVRIAIEERLSFSPDALTGMEQNLRFGGVESMENKIYGRLSAWQNWIFQRPNAVGERGALTMYEQPEQPIFDYRRT